MWGVVPPGARRPHGSHRQVPLPHFPTPPRLFVVDVLRKSRRPISLDKPAYGSACPHNRRATVPPMLLRSFTSFPPSASTDNSSPFASPCAAPRTGFGAGGGSTPCPEGGGSAGTRWRGGPAAPARVRAARRSVAVSFAQGAAEVAAMEAAHPFLR